MKRQHIGTWSSCAFTLALLPALLSGSITHEAIAASRPTLACPESIDSLPASPLFERDDRRLRARHLIVVRKSQRRIMTYSKGKLVAGSCLPMALGVGGPEGPKRVEGDRKTPEGWYRTSNDPYSSWYRAIAIHYPNANDAAHGLATKRISKRTYRRIVRALERRRKPPQTTALGGLILIHGNGSPRSKDWTLGCVGMTNRDIDRLRSTLPRHMRTNILILP